MRKNLLIIILIVLMPNVVFAADNQIIANIVDYKIIINEQEIKLSETVVTVNDRTYLPLRNIAEVLGMDVNWNKDTKEISITNKSNAANDSSSYNDKITPLRHGTLNAAIADYRIIFNDTPNKLKEVIITINDRTYLPLREIAEILGMDVEWDGEENKIIITYYDAEADQINLFPFEQDGLYGFMDNEGKIKIPPVYMDVSRFSEGLAAVKVAGGNHSYMIEGGVEVPSGYWGYINKAGEIVIPCTFPIAYSFSEGIAVVVPRCYTADESDRIWRLGFPSYGPFMYINKSGKFITDEEFLSAGGFDSGYALVSPNSYSFIPTEKKNIFTIVNQNEHREYYINKKGEYIDIPLNITSYGEFRDGYAMVRTKDIDMCFIDTNFDILFIRINTMFYMGDGYFAVIKGGKYGVINDKNELVIDYLYDNMGSFRDGLICVSKNGYYGYINIKNEIVIPFIYDYAYDFSDDYAFVRRKYTHIMDVNSIINKKGEVVATNLPGTYRPEFVNGLCKMYNPNGEPGFYYINIKGERVDPID